MVCSTPSKREDPKGKFYLFLCNGTCTIIVWILLVRDLADHHSSGQEMAFQIIPLYLQTLTVLVGGALLGRSTFSYCGDRGDMDILQRVCWTLVLTCLVGSNVVIYSNGKLRRPAALMRTFLVVIPLVFELHYNRIYVKYKKQYQTLNKRVADRCRSALELLTIRVERKTLNDRLRKSTRAYGAQAMAAIAMAAITTVFKIHRTLRSADPFTVTSADLLDTLQCVVRLFLLCKVSRDVAKEASDTETRLLNLNTGMDEHFENEVSFFLWEVNNPPVEVRAYGLFALDLRLFVSVLSWCIGFILILLQFRWPRTH